jgi:hypothetical protein
MPYYILDMTRRKKRFETTGIQSDFQIHAISLASQLFYKTYLLISIKNKN